MKKLILILLLIPVFAFSQAIYSPKSYTPFIAGNDTILSAANLESAECYVGHWLGACVLAIQADTMAGGGTVAKDIKVFLKIKVNPLSYGVVMDSIAVDSIQVVVYDSADVNQEVPLYIDLSNQSWWTWTEFIQVILDPAASADSIRIVARLKGQ